MEQHPESRHLKRRLLRCEHPPDSMATVYTRLSAATATAEALSHHRYYNLPIETALPRVLVSIRVSLSRVLDLTERRVSSNLL